MTAASRRTVKSSVLPCASLAASPARPPDSAASYPMAHASTAFAQRCAHDLAFADLYSVEGAARIDRLFVAHLAGGGRGARRPLGRGARRPRRARAQGGVGAADRARSASRGLRRGALRHRDRRARARGAAPRARAAVRGQAPLRPAQGDERVPRRRRGDVRRAGAAARTRGGDGRAVHRARFRQCGDALAAGRGGATPPRSTSRCATPRGPRTRPRAAPRTRVACCSARRASSTA